MVMKVAWTLKVIIHHFCICMMPFPQTRPEDCCNLKCCNALRMGITVFTACAISLQYQPQCTPATAMSAVQYSVGDSLRRCYRFLSLLPGFSDFDQSDQRRLIKERWFETWLVRKYGQEECAKYVHSIIASNYAHFWNRSFPKRIKPNSSESKPTKMKSNHSHWGTQLNTAIDNAFEKRDEKTKGASHQSLNQSSNNMRVPVYFREIPSTLIRLCCMVDDS